MEVAHDGTTSLPSDGRPLQAKPPIAGLQLHGPQPLPGQAPEARLKMGSLGAFTYSPITVIE